ncbi:hypothetical protein HF844_02115 [Bifidobacterium thermophilum]|uniref:Uncharacterized protein n=1 Tax=Bifidobacterium thermophilum TaxID=33905 RepID=A0A7X9NQ66_9BIFI|nr:hypothetical protein [Bifidobacterium thermophilum]NME61603.1 hypothetical protein [Bifidobacterium thermophilum]
MPFHVSAAAAAHPAPPSVTSVHGAGSLENSRVYAAGLSVSHHWNVTGVPSAAAIATSRHQPYGTYVPSASTAWQGDSDRGISGLTRQHHWMRRMNVRGDTPSVAAACASVIRPVVQTRNAWNSAAHRALPPSPALLARQRMHRHRCLPDDVVPFLHIGAPHIVHSLADFLLPIRQAQQEHVFRKVKREHR